LIFQDNTRKKRGKNALKWPKRIPKIKSPFYLIFLFNIFMSLFLRLVLNYYCNLQCIGYEWILNFPHPLIYYLIFMSSFLRLVLDNYLNNYTHTCVRIGKRLTTQSDVQACED
jgi:polyferredoxin